MRTWDNVPAEIFRNRVPHASRYANVVQTHYGSLHPRRVLMSMKAARCGHHADERHRNTEIVRRQESGTDKNNFLELHLDGTMPRMADAYLFHSICQIAEPNLRLRNSSRTKVWVLSLAVTVLMSCENANRHSPATKLDWTRRST